MGRARDLLVRMAEICRGVDRFALSFPGMFLFVATSVLAGLSPAWCNHPWTVLFIAAQAATCIGYLFCISLTLLFSKQPAGRRILACVVIYVGLVLVWWDGVRFDLAVGHAWVGPMCACGVHSATVHVVTFLSLPLLTPLAKLMAQIPGYTRIMQGDSEWLGICMLGCLALTQVVAGFGVLWIARRKSGWWSRAIVMLVFALYWGAAIAFLLRNLPGHAEVVL